MLPAFFGGVSLTDYDTVTRVSAVTTSYFLDVSEDWRAMLGDRWEKQLLEDVQNKAPTFCPDLEVSMFVSNTPAWEMERLARVFFFSYLVMLYIYLYPYMCFQIEELCHFNIVHQCIHNGPLLVSRHSDERCCEIETSGRLRWTLLRNPGHRECE